VDEDDFLEGGILQTLEAIIMILCKFQRISKRIHKKKTHAHAHKDGYLNKTGRGKM
jgi:hypothetical protein